MKVPVKHIIQLVFAGLVVLFGINYVWRGFSVGEAQGFLEVAGSLNSEEQVLLTEGGERLDTLFSTEPPEIKYAGKSCRVGETVNIKSLFQVKLPDHIDFASGEEEMGFSLYIKDIMDDKGESYLAEGGEEITEETEEITSDFTYKKSEGNICFHKSGIYIIKVEAWGNYGRKVVKEIRIPVEPD